MIANLPRYNFGEEEDDNGYLKPSVTQSDNGVWVKFEDIKELLSTDKQQLQCEIAEDMSEVALSLSRSFKKVESLKQKVWRLSHM